MEFLARVGSAGVHGPFPRQRVLSSRRRELPTAAPALRTAPRVPRGLCGPGIWDLAERRPAHLLQVSPGRALRVLRPDLPPLCFPLLRRPLPSESSSGSASPSPPSPSDRLPSSSGWVPPRPRPSAHPSVALPRGPAPGGPAPAAPAAPGAGPAAPASFLSACPLSSGHHAPRRRPAPVTCPSSGKAPPRSSYSPSCLTAGPLDSAPGFPRAHGGGWLRPRLLGARRQRGRPVSRCVRPRRAEASGWRPGNQAGRPGFAWLLLPTLPLPNSCLARPEVLGCRGHWNGPRTGLRCGCPCL